MREVLNIQNRNGVIIGSFKGENNFNSEVTQFAKEQIFKYVSSDTPNLVFILDMNHLTRFDSSTLGCLVASLRAAKKYNNSFILCNLTSKFKEVLDIMHLTKMFTIYETLEEFFEI